MKIRNSRHRTFWLSFLGGALLLFIGIRTNFGISTESAYEKIRTLVDVIDQIQSNYVEDVELKDLIYGAANGMMRTLDPFSQFLPPTALKEMKVETEGEFGGIGIRVAIGDDGWLTVVTPLPGTPAFQAGVFPRDRIIKIDDQSTQGITLEKAVNKLRGKPQTKVVITIERDEEGATQSLKKINKDFTLVREVIKIQTIYSRLIPDTDIGYLRITEFNVRTPQDMREALTRLTKEGMKSLIFDLRNNPGGLLPSAIDVAKEFMGDEKIIVYTQGRRPESKIEYHAGRLAHYNDLPMVTLINEGSASGSEILAGALQDNKRAVLIGARTFGKASVQSVINLPDGSGLRLTTAYYYTPLGRLIHKKEFVRKHDNDEESQEQQTAEEKLDKGEKKDLDKEKSEAKKEQWGIEPDINVPIDREMAAKVQSSFDLAYFPDHRESKPIRDIFKKKEWLEKRHKGRAIVE